MNAKLKMAVKPVRFAMKPENLVGWCKIPDREHWLVRAPDGRFVGEIFQVQAGHQYYALVYEREYPHMSGCVHSTSLRGLTIFMTGVAINGDT